MSEWQKTVHQSIDSLEKLRSYVAGRFGQDVADREIDVAALAPAFDNFQMRITPAALDLIQEPGDAIWNQYVPTMQELDVVDGVIDSPHGDDTHRAPWSVHQRKVRGKVILDAMFVNGMGVPTTHFHELVVAPWISQVGNLPG